MEISEKDEKPERQLNRKGTKNAKKDEAVIESVIAPEGGDSFSCRFLLSFANFAPLRF